MSGKKKSASVLPETEGNLFFFSALKDTMIIKDSLVFIAWISAILLVAGIIWALTQPVRNRFLVKAVNQVLEQSEDPRRLTEPSYNAKGASMFAGSNFEMGRIQGERKNAIVFSFIGEGTFFPCIAVISSEGKVEEFIPLNNYGEKLLQHIPPGILKIYSKHIEKGSGL